MSGHDDYSVDTDFSTPVPELNDHSHHRQTSTPPPAGAARRATGGTMSPGIRSVSLEAIRDPQGSFINTMARDFEEAVSDGESMHGQENNSKSRRGTVTTLDPRSASPPNSVKAFADARRRERGVSSTERDSIKAFAEARRMEDGTLFRAMSGSSRRSIISRHRPKDTEGKGDRRDSVADDENKENSRILYDILDDFISAEEERAKNAPKESESRVFHDLRPQKHDANGVVVTAAGDIVEGSSASSIDEKTELKENVKIEEEEQQRSQDGNRFEYFSSNATSTIHAAELGDLVMPGENLRNLFSLPRDDDNDGVWWLSVNNPTKDEIRTICKAFRVHPLTMEDIEQEESREKIELFPNYYFACFRSFHIVEDESGQDYEPFHIHMIVFPHYTISFSFSPNEHARNVRHRINTVSELMSLSSDWICYALIDDIVDAFGPEIKKLERLTDIIEDQVFIARTDDMHEFLRKIGITRRNVIGLMKLLGGKADIIKGFTKRIQLNYRVAPRDEIGLYLGDIQDHVVTMMGNLGQYEKMLSRSHSNYLAQLSIDNITQGNQANRVLSKITLVAGLLVPLNLITGLFGMNVMVPFRSVDNVGPFFGILAFLFLFVGLSFLVARRARWI